MNEQDTQALRRRMAEAVSLPPEDPQRRAVLREVAEASDWAEAEWLHLVEEDERLRIDLLRVQPPAELKERLTELPAGAPRPRGRWLPRRFGFAAAAAVLLIAALLVAINPPAGDALQTRMRAFSTLAAQHAHDHREYRHQPADASDLIRRVADGVRYPVRVPEMPPGSRLLGAQVCSLGGHRVICTEWIRNGRSYTLYIFCPTDYDLPWNLDRRSLRQEHPWDAQAEAQEITFWSDDHCAYALLPEAKASPPDLGENDDPA